MKRFLSRFICLKEHKSFDISLIKLEGEGPDSQLSLIYSF